MDDPLPLLRSSETLITNLLRVTAFVPTIHWAETDITDRGEAWAAMAESREYEGGFMLWSDRVYSFVDLDGALAPLCKGAPSSFRTADWADSEDPVRRRNFVSLLNYTVRAMRHKELRFHPYRKYVFHAPTPDLKPNKLKVGRGSGQTVFQVYKDEENKVRYCRHHAAHLNFRCWDGEWFLEINPAYHYTRDGERESLFAAEYLSKIKRLERNPAVRGQVEHWAQFLAQQQSDNLFGHPDRRIEFGQLETVTVDASIDEPAWIVPKEAESSDEQLALDEGSVAS